MIIIYLYNLFYFLLKKIFIYILIYKIYYFWINLIIYILKIIKHNL